jgi:hypothetical protein
MGLTKAQLYNADTGTLVVECHFNPDQLTIDRTNQFKAQYGAGSSLADVHFQGADPRTLSMSLVFDTYEARSDVRAATNKVLGLMDAETWEGTTKDRQRPPHVLFRWGDFETFPAVLTKLTQKFTLFLNSGLPVRAILHITLQEVPTEATRTIAQTQTQGQNPTSEIARAGRARVIQPGDVIDFLAADELGDPHAWRRLAEANGIDDPRRLRVGQTLVIPADLYR